MAFLGDPTSYWIVGGGGSGVSTNTITIGAYVTTSGGTVTAAGAGDYISGVALGSPNSDGLVPVQLSYQVTPGDIYGLPTQPAYDLDREVSRRLLDLMRTHTEKELRALIGLPDDAPVIEVADRVGRAIDLEGFQCD
jgi:hypothetical protein